MPSNRYPGQGAVSASQTAFGPRLTASQSMVRLKSSHRARDATYEDITPERQSLLWRGTAPVRQTVPAGPDVADELHGVV